MSFVLNGPKNLSKHHKCLLLLNFPFKHFVELLMDSKEDIMMHVLNCIYAHLSHQPGNGTLSQNLSLVLELQR